MSINKRVRKSMLTISIIAIVVLMIISLWRIILIRKQLTTELEQANTTITTDNTEDMLSMSLRLAQATAERNARRISGDFSRIRGELETLRGDIENIYNSDGIRECLTDVTRCEEYIVSQAAEISQEEIDATVDRLCGLTAMFDNVLAHEDKISLAYVVLENGMVFSSTDTFYPDVEKADMRTRDWYKNAIAAGDVSWAELYVGSDGRNYVTVASPVFDTKGKVFGVVAFDLRVSEISEVVLNPESTEFSDAFILGRDSTVLLGTKDDETVKADAELSAFLKDMTLKPSASGYFSNDSMIAGFDRIDETGWRLVTMLDYETVLAPVRKVAATVNDVSASTTDHLNNNIRSTLRIFAIFLVAIILAVFFVARSMAKRITKPIEKLSSGANEIGNGNIDYVIPDLGDDEIGGLAKQFNKMTKRLKEYIANLTAVTAEKERIGAELNVATKIQADMLPSIFPAFPDRHDFDICASMTPAKEVGGDFYDFFMLDPDHIALVIADVSGKGVPAALFMVIAKTLLKNQTSSMRSPKEILEKVNNQLCENNTSEMFVTTWLCIFELSTGHCVAANAGHEFPAIRHGSGEFELIHDRHGFVLAGMEDSRYREYEFDVEPGGTLFVYTDGVAEATSAANELFGTDRMLEALNKEPDATPAGLLKNVKAHIDEFVGEAPQFDDITMLCIKRTN